MQSPHYRPDIDGLRGVAIVLVMLYHAKVPFFEGGFLGVDIFFVISGYVITALLQREMAQGTFSFKQFYLRRARRLMPALWVMSVGVAVGVMCLMSPLYVVAFAKNLLASMLYSANLYLWWSQADYFHSPTAFWPMMHTWSLAIEEQFYVLFPPVLWLLMRKDAKKVTWVIACALIASLLWYVLENKALHGVDAFYQPHLRMWELLLGCCVARGVCDGVMKHRVHHLWALLGVAGMLVALYLASLHNERKDFLYVILMGVSTALVIAASRKQPSWLSRMLGYSLLVSVGEISYSLYLWHWPLLSLAHYHYLDGLTPIQTAIVIQIAFVFAFLSHRYVETPWRKRRDGRYSDMSAGLLAVQGVLVMAIIAVVMWSAYVMLSPTLSVEQRIEQSRLQGNPYNKTCNIAGFDTKKVPEKGCVMGKTSLLGSYQGVLFGDSHADHYAPAIDALAQLDNLSVRQATHYGCLPLIFSKNVEMNEDCKEFNRLLLDEIDQQHDVRFVVMAGSWADAIGAQILTAAQFEESLKNTLTWFAQRGIEVLILHQVPASAKDGNYDVCLQKLQRYSPKAQVECISSTLAHEKMHLADEVVQRVSARYPNAHLYDPFKQMCSDTCRFYDAGGLYYRDNSHLTRHGALYLKNSIAPVWKATITKAMQKAKQP